MYVGRKNYLLYSTGVATFSALGGRAMIWGAYDSKSGRQIAVVKNSK